MCLSFTLLFSSHFNLYSVLNLFFHVDNAKANITCASANRGVLVSGRIHSSLTTSTTRRLLKSSSRRNPATKTGCRRTCVTRDSTMRPSGKRSLHHCPFMSDKNQRTEDKAYHSYEESLLPTQSFFAHSRTGRPVHELSSLSSCSRKKPSRKMENETIRILLERQKKSKFTLILQPRFKDTNFKYPGIEWNYRVSAKRN